MNASSTISNGDEITQMDKPMGEKILNWTILILSVIMVLYHFIYVRVLIQAPDLHANTHLGFALVLTYLFMIRKNHKWWYVKLGLAVLSLVCILYVQFF